jgi:hypothetical protein
MGLPALMPKSSSANPPRLIGAVVKVAVDASVKIVLVP